MTTRAHKSDDAHNAAFYGNDCRGKAPHPSKRHALAEGRTLVASGVTRPGLVLNAYRCRQCKKWHLGHSPRRYVDATHRVRSAPTALEHEVADAIRAYLDAVV